jgi:molecular chaperone HtpG
MSTEMLPFKTELKQLLHLIVHSLYTHKEIFLRELISNASDAIDTLRFQALTRPELLGEEGDAWKIKITPDEAQGTLTISDNGVGMSQAAIVENLGTIARSGTRAFLEALKNTSAADRPGLIGQFGVGFYSAFMVADRVTVLSRPAGPGHEGVRWESDGQGEFSVAPADKPQRGTDVILHLRPEDRDFLKPWKIRQVVRQYSDFIEHPVVMEVEREEAGKKTVAEETLNARKAIWLRSKAEITTQEYNDFYKHLSHDTEDPLQVIHYVAEGMLEFRALLYVPAHKPWDLHWGPSKKGLQLFIQRVLILDDWEALLPPYLRFVKGVVDSPDLTLNVSREVLQQSAPLEKIKSNLVGKVLGTLDEMKRTEYERYARFFRELGAILKEGVAQDWSNREKVADLLLFESTRTAPGQLISLAQYVERMPVSQGAIFYLIGEDRGLLAGSPYLEAFRAREQEVLLLTDPIDEFVVQALPEYRGKKLQAADRGELPAQGVDEARQQAFQPLLDFLRGKLPEVQDVRLSGRLRESAACLVAGEGEAGAHLERLMRRLGRGEDLPASKRVLEINPEHSAVEAIRKLHAQAPADPRLEVYGRLLYDQAVLGEGSKVLDTAAFARRINEVLARDASA